MIDNNYYESLEKNLYVLVTRARKDVYMERPSYLDWLVEEDGITIKDGIPIKCYKIDYKEDETVLDKWALHIRRNYIEDEDLLLDAEINEMTVEQYLHDYVIPQRNEVLGPTVRAGDITEILVSDLLEFIFGYSVPRYKQKNRSGKNNSEHGTDVIAYKYFNGCDRPSEKDELIATEVKAALTSTGYTPLENAIRESKKDEQRLARTIDHCRKRLKEFGCIEQSGEVARFLLKPDNNYKLTYAAAGISSCQTVDQEIELSASGEELQISSKQKVFFIHGKTLMNLAHKIYERCKK